MQSIYTFAGKKVVGWDPLDWCIKDRMLTCFSDYVQIYGDMTQQCLPWSEDSNKPPQLTRTHKVLKFRLARFVDGTESTTSVAEVSLWGTSSLAVRFGVRRGRL